MADRHRTETGEFDDRIPATDVLEVFDDLEDTARPLTAQDVADDAGMARRTAYNKLNTLVDRGVLETRKVGARARVFWIPHVGSDGVSDAIEGAIDHSPATDDESFEDVDERVLATVERVASSWDDDHRLEDRKRAAAVVLQHAIETGEHVGKDDAIERFRDAYPVDGQNAETWYRQNGRKVLSDVGEYSRGKHGYRVDRDDLDDVDDA